MKFYIESTCYSGDKLIEKYPQLKSFGYENNCVDVDSLDDLMTLLRTTNPDNGIILFSAHTVFDRKRKKWMPTDIPEIEIYDSFRE